MPISTRLRTFILPTLVVLLSVSWLGSAAAEDSEKPQYWDRDVVTKLAVELKAVFARGFEGSKTAPPQETAFQQRQRDAAQGAIRRSRDAAARFADELEAGADRLESEILFRQVADQVREMNETRGEAVPTAQGKRVLARIDALLRQLEAQYRLPEPP